MSWRVVRGDCIDAMAAMEPESVHAVVCDPPYGIGFMGKTWDGPAIAEAAARDRERRKSLGPASASRPGRAEPRTSSAFGDPAIIAGPVRGGRDFQEWCEAWAREALRVLKPGAYMIAAGGSRTYHRLTCGIEDAGFEIRDCLTWHQGSGFPKSRDVTKDLRSLPACACDVPGEVGAVNSAAPTGSVGAGVGAEPGAMPLAGLAADLAGGVGAQSGARAAGPGANVEAGVEQIVGDGAPVVLGAPSVAPLAAGDDVGADVGGVEVDPESLWDQVMRDGGHPSAVDARAASDDLGGESGPADAFVLPLAATPSGVAGTGHTAAVGNGHAGTPAVDAGPLAVAAEVGAALGTGEGSHDLKCDRCGGVRRELIPDGLGTALKPATEFMVVARKPLSGTVAATVVAHGTGALNIDGCRVNAPGAHGTRGRRKFSGFSDDGVVYGDHSGDKTPENPLGRWPANVILSHAEGCNGECVPGCPVAVLDAQTGELHAPGSNGRRGRASEAIYEGGWGDREQRASFTDSGGASRFFYVAKASSAERSAGLDGEEVIEGARRNVHPLGRR